MQFRNILFGIGIMAGMILPDLVSAQDASNGELHSQFQLATPWAKDAATIFGDNTIQELEFGLEGAVIRYTLDGTRPSPESPRYTGPIPVENTCVLKARTFHPGYIPSEALTIHYFKAAQLPEIRQISLKPDPDPAYPGRNAEGLVDGVKGTRNFKSGDWMGFPGHDAEIRVSFAREASLRRITISLLADPGAWIFPPQEIGAYTLENGHELVQLAVQTFESPGPDLEAGFRYITLEGPFKGQQFLISIRQMDQIPDWHQGKGTAPWLFIDEIIFE